MDPAGSQAYLASTRFKSTSLDSLPASRRRSKQPIHSSERGCKSQIDPEPNDPASSTFLPVGDAISGISWAPTIVRVEEPDAKVLNADSIVLARQDHHHAAGSKDFNTKSSQSKSSSSPKSTPTSTKPKLSSSSYRSASYSSYHQQQQQHHLEKQRHGMMSNKASSQPNRLSSSSNASKTVSTSSAKDPAGHSSMGGAGVHIRSTPLYKDQVRPVDQSQPDFKDQARSINTTTTSKGPLLKKMNKDPHTKNVKAKSFSGRVAEPEYEFHDSRTMLPTMAMIGNPHQAAQEYDISSEADAPTFKSHISHKGIAIGDVVTATCCVETNASSMADRHKDSCEPVVAAHVHAANSTSQTQPNFIPYTMMEKKSPSPTSRGTQQQHLPSIDEQNTYEKANSDHSPHLPKSFIWVAVLLQILLIAVIASLAISKFNCQEVPPPTTGSQRILQDGTLPPNFSRNDISSIARAQLEPTTSPVPSDYTQLLSMEPSASPPPSGSARPTHVQTISKIPINTINLTDKPSRTPAPSTHTISPTIRTTSPPNSKDMEALKSCSRINSGLLVGIALGSEVLLLAGIYLYYRFWKSSQPKSDNIASSQEGTSNLYQEPPPTSTPTQVRYVEESMIQWDQNLNPINDNDNNDDEEDLYPFSVVSIAQPR